MMIPRLHLPWSTCNRLDWQTPSVSDRPSHRAAPLQQRWGISQAWHRYPGYHRHPGFCNVILVPFRLYTQKRTSKLRQLCASSIIMLHLAFLGLWYSERLSTHIAIVSDRSTAFSDMTMTNHFRLLSASHRFRNTAALSDKYLCFSTSVPSSLLEMGMSSIFVHGSKYPSPWWRNGKSYSRHIRFFFCLPQWHCWIAVFWVDSCY